MQFEIKNLHRSIHGIMREIGYVPTHFQEPSEFSIVRKMLGGEYPRFHIYVKQHGADFSFNLHLDQKKPSYEGSKGHSGEYEGKVVEDEVERIKHLLR